MAKEMDLDELSNCVADAIDAGNHEDAEKLCHKLLSEYPDVFDGHQHLARLRKAQGRFQEAADHYQKVLDMMRNNPENVDQDTIQYITELRDRALAQARA